MVSATMATASAGLREGATAIGSRRYVMGSRLIRMRPPPAELPRELLRRVRHHRTELSDALVTEPRHRPRERNGAQRLGMLVVYACRDAARGPFMFLVVEGIAALTNHAQRRPHGFRRNDGIVGDAGQSDDFEDRADLLIRQRRKNRLADARRVQRHAAAKLDKRAHRFVTLHLGDENG